MVDGHILSLFSGSTPRSNRELKSKCEHSRSNQCVTIPHCGRNPSEPSMLDPSHDFCPTSESHRNMARVMTDITALLAVRLDWPTKSKYLGQALNFIWPLNSRLLQDIVHIQHGLHNCLLSVCGCSFWRHVTIHCKTFVFLLYQPFV